MTAIKDRVVAKELLFVTLADVMSVWTLLEDLDYTSLFSQELPIRVDIYHCDDLVVLSVGSEDFDKLLGVVKHMKATLATSMLLQHWEVSDLSTDRISVLL